MNFESGRPALYHLRFASIGPVFRRTLPCGRNALYYFASQRRPVDRPNQPFTIAILPWRPRRGWPIPDTHPTKTTDEDLAINAVPIADEIAWPHCASYSKPLTARASTRVRTHKIDGLE